MLVVNWRGLKFFLLNLWGGVLDPDGWGLQREGFWLRERLVFLSVLYRVRVVVFAVLGCVDGIIVEVGREGGRERGLARLEARGVRCGLSTQLSEVEV